MPYITQDKRDRLDPIIDQVIEEIVNLELDDDQDNTEGNLNYLITRLLLVVYGDRDSTRYASINDAIGLLECIKLEFYRKVAAPYEDQKEFENGAVKRHSQIPEVVGTVTVDSINITPEQEAALQALADQAQELGLYDTDMTPIRRLKDIDDE